MNQVEHIWLQYHDALLRFTRSRVSDADAAEDIVQEVFIRINSGIDKLRMQNRLRSWIYQITRNAIIDYYRTREMSIELPEHLVIPEDEDDPTEELRDRLGDCIRQMIDTLPHTYREVMMLSEVEQLKQKQIAEKMGLSLAAVKSRIQRGRGILKDMLVDCCTFEKDNNGRIIDFGSENDSCVIK